MKHFCREASRLASDAYERDLTLLERFRFRTHLLMCKACANYAFNLDILNRIFSSMHRHADEHAPCLSEDDRRKIHNALQDARGSDA